MHRTLIDVDVTFQYVHALAIEIHCLASYVVEVPCSVEVVDFRGPNATAPVGVGILVDDLWRRSLQSFNGGSTRKLKVGPLG